MSSIDLDRLLKEISVEAPSGPKDMGYDPAFLALQEKIHQIEGKLTVKGDKKPSWIEVQEAAVELLTQTHDLRAAVFLTRALLHNSGLVGLRDGLSLILGLIERYWDTLYPRPEDKEDPLEIIGITEELCEWETIIGPLIKATLCDSRTMGSFCLRDIRVASGRNTDELILTKEEKKSPPNLATIEEALKDSAVEALQATNDAIRRSSQILGRLKTVFNEKIGSEKGPDLKRLSQVLKEMEAFFENQMEPVGPPDDSPPEQSSTVEGSETEPCEEADGIVSVMPQQFPPGVNTRTDVIRLLNNICAYYDKNEPGSPVPLLLKRASQLVGKSFFEIVEDLAPESAAQIKKNIAGDLKKDA